jgi:hypothetical protein
MCIQEVLVLLSERGTWNFARKYLKEVQEYPIDIAQRWTPIQVVLLSYKGNLVDSSRHFSKTNVNYSNVSPHKHARNENFINPLEKLISERMK